MAGWISHKCERNFIMDSMAEPTISATGLPTLPPRDPPTGRHYLISLARIQTELTGLLTQARAEAAERLAALRASDAPEAEIAESYHELSFLRHAKGPMFQAALLVELGQRKIRLILSDGQSPLERVREIAAAITVAINTLPRGRVEQTVLHLHKPLDPDEAGSANDRRAALFLANTAAANRRTAGLIAPQRLLDAIISKAGTSDGRDPRAVQAELEQARQKIAARIRAGEEITAKTSLTSLNDDILPDQNRENDAA
jgi:cell filamentation protein